MKKTILTALIGITTSINAQTISYVDKDATGNNDGSSWTDAYIQLEDGFVNATNGIEIWVADGTYKRQGSDRNLVFNWSADSVKVYGGFASGETLLSQRDWISNKTIMSGDIGTVGSNSDNCYTVFGGATNGSAVSPIEYGYLDGFIIQDGNANFNGSGWGSIGSGFNMLGGGKKMEFHNCEFSDNNAKYSTIYAQAGNGATNHTKDLILDGCIIKDNTGRQGVGTRIDCTENQMNLTITNCLYTNNEIKDMGSLGQGLSSVIMFIGHNASATNIDANIINTTFANNQDNGSNTTHPNGTIMLWSKNSSGVKNLAIDNCIFWGNINDTASVINYLTGYDFDAISVKNTISENTSLPTTSITSNINNQDPLFVSSTDFTLQNGSPANNIGSITGLTIPNTDLNGNPRVAGGIIDLGCYEFQEVANSNESTNSSKLSTFPNPTTGKVTFSTLEQINTIEIYNLTGQKVLTFNNTNNITISELTNGIYMAKIITINGQVSTHKIIKK